MRKFNVCTPLLFENNLLISLSKKWINVFTCIPQFEISINRKNQLCITSKQKIKNTKFSLSESNGKGDEND